MKTQSQIRIGSLSLLVLFSLALAVIPASAQTLYENGPINGNGNGWGISSGDTTSDSINLNSSRSNVYDISIGVWEEPTGNVLKTVDWSFTSQENGGTVFASGTASGANLTDTFLSVNQYGYDIDLITVSGLNVSLEAGTYWLNLQNAQTPSGDEVFWDENSGVGCQSPGCPSLASESAVGTIPSEAFTLNGTPDGGSTPEPSSLALFGSGVLGIGGLLRRRFLG
jgi:PEP-CTERM motif